MINVYHFKNNYGDDLAWFIVSHLADDRLRYCIPFDWKRFFINFLIFARDALFRRCFNTFPWPYSAKQDVLMVTGSLLGLAKKNCTVWGCGITFSDDRPDPRAKIAAVRGPCTMECVRAAGISSGGVATGDPGLLMPLLLPRRRKADFKVGIIAHINDVQKLAADFKNDGDILFITLDTRRQSVESVTERICSCESIFSSSLHGLIVAHAYGIPALRIDSANIPGDGVKFKDYLASVGIGFYEPFSAGRIAGLTPQQRTELFHDRMSDALPGADIRKIQIDLLKAAPFPLKPQFRELIRA